MIEMGKYLKTLLEKGVSSYFFPFNILSFNSLSYGMNTLK